MATFGLQTSNQYFQPPAQYQPTQNLLSGFGMMEAVKQRRAEEEQTAAAAAQKKEEADLETAETLIKQHASTWDPSTPETARATINTGKLRADISKAVGGTLSPRISTQLDHLDSMMGDPSKLGEILPSIQQYQGALGIERQKTAEELGQETYQKELNKLKAKEEYPEEQGYGPNFSAVGEEGPGIYRMNLDTNKAERIPGVAPPAKSGMDIEVGPDGQVRVSQGPGAGQGITDKTTKRKMDERLFNAGERLSRLTRIKAKFQPKHQRGWEQVKQWMMEKGDKWLPDWTGVGLSAEQKKDLAAYKTHRQRSLDNLSQYVKEMSGVAVSEQEYKRLSQSLPDPIKDGPTAFEAKMNEGIEQQMLAIARYNYYINKGLNEQDIKTILANEKQIGLEGIRSMMEDREEELEKLGLDDAAIEQKMGKEFGLY